MNKRMPPNPRWESLLDQAANHFPYPPTPDIAGQMAQQHTQIEPVQRRRLVWAALVALFVLIISLLAVPPVRAALLEFLQIGVVRIWLVEPTQTPAPPTVTPRPTAPPLSSVLELTGETTLATAQSVLHFPLRQPTYPADLGAPDRVYLQDLDGTAVILVWLNHDHPDQVRMSLHLLTSGVIVKKMEPKVVTETKVRQQRAVWTEGPYLVETHSHRWESLRLVQGHVLIWTEGDITYRLETDLPLEEAVRVAESLQ